MRADTFSRSKLFYLFGNIALGLAYYGSAELSRWLASTPDNVTPVWPPDGIAVAAVFLGGLGMLPGVCLGSFLANIWAFWDPSSWLSLTSSVLGVLGIAGGTTLGTGIGVLMLQSFTRTAYPLNRVKHVIQLLLFAGLLGPVINAIAGVTVLCSLGIVPWSAYLDVWLTWWVSNVAGIFIVTPAVISWQPAVSNWQLFSAQKPTQQDSAVFDAASDHSHSHLTVHPPVSEISPSEISSPLTNRRRNQRLKNWAEACLICGLIIAFGRAAFWQSYPLDYMLIPLLIWPTFRFGQRGATLAAVGISMMAILGTVRGLGSFASDDLNTSLTLLQSFIAVTVFTALVVAAVLAECITAEENLKTAIADLAVINQELEHRVQTRTQELDTKNKRLESTLNDLNTAQAQLVQSEKMSGLGQMVAGIAHEINNPVNFIHGNLQHLRSYVEDMMRAVSKYQIYYPEPNEELSAELDALDIAFIQADTPKILTSMTTGTERIREIVLSLRNFSRVDESALKQADVHEGIESTLLILQHRLKSPTVDSNSEPIALIRDYGEVPLIECYPGLLNQAVMNILTNAIDALQAHLKTEKPQAERPTITIRTDVVNIDSVQIGDVDQWVRIAIADNGPGIDPETQSKIFDPFFTTKPIGQGTGMGLAISYQIITQKHSGKFTFESSRGNGTEFMIQIPLKQA